jgi:TolA-binding protein
MKPTPFILVLAAAFLGGAAEAQWAVPEAPLRFDFTVESPPSAPSAGILVFLPDGGLLPAPEPKATVLDEAGKPVDVEALWHNPQEGLGLVIAKPATPGFSVYISRQARLTRNDRMAFTPGPLFYVKSGNANLETATHLSGGSPPGREAFLGQVDLIGQRSNPFGADLDFSGCFSAWIRIEKAGRYYFATISDEGSAVKIDGKALVDWPGIHTRAEGAKGQFGSFVELAAGNHSVEYAYFNAAGPSEALLAWRLPGSATNPLPELVPASAYLHSGTAKLTGVADKDGGPVALPRAPCESYFWFADQPDNLHHLFPLFADRNPSNTVYEWKMDNGKSVKESDFLWLFEGNAPRTVTLTARLGNRVSTASCVVRLDATPAAASLLIPSQLQQYRTALLARCKAAPGARPAADWPPGLWQVLVNVAEPFKGQALLDDLFERSREDLAQALAPAERALLEDLYIQNLRYSDKTRAAAWLDKFEKDEKNVDRRRSWTLEKIELALYQAGDTNLARQTAATLAAQAPGTEAGVLALIRLGDIEALSGRFDEARAQYAQAQAQTPRKAGALATTQPSGPGAAGGLARSRQELLQKKPETGSSLARSKSAMEDEHARKTAAPKGGSLFNKKVDSWKAEAVRGGAYYETIRDLILKGYLREARQELRNWELELPSEKLGGEYPVAEADYYRSIRDYKRSLTILSTYRKAVDTSPFMPKAMGMEMDCLQRLGRDAEAAALAAVVLKEFPGTPVAGQARLIAEAAGADRHSSSPPVEAP